MALAQKYSELKEHKALKFTELLHDSHVTGSTVTRLTHIHIQPLFLTATHLKHPILLCLTGGTGERMADVTTFCQP